MKVDACCLCLHRVDDNSDVEGERRAAFPEEEEAEETPEDAQETMRRKYGRNVAVPRTLNVNDAKRDNLEIKRRFKNKTGSVRKS